MAGLILFGIVGIWAAFAIFLAYAATKRAQSPFAKGLVFLVATIGIFLAPVADEFVGQHEFKRLCASAENVNILGTIPVGDEFYTHAGDWRLGTYPWSDDAAHTRLVRQADSLVRWDHGTHRPAPSFVPIKQYDVKIYEAGSDRLLAEWTGYSFGGGFLRRNIWPSSKGCRPLLMRQPGYGLYREIFVYHP